MQCLLTTLQEKEVINLHDGARLGYVSNIEIDSCSGKVISIRVYSKGKFCGLGKGTEIKILWEQIEVIGEETILVDYRDLCPTAHTEKPQKKISLDGIFR